MTYCTFLEREYLHKHDGHIGYTSASSMGYDTATENPKHKNAVKTMAQHVTGRGIVAPNARNISGDVVDDYKNARKRDNDIAKKADRMAKRATGVRTSDYTKASKGDNDALERANKRELAADAARRHMRRHGYAEAGIFADIELI